MSAIAHIDAMLEAMQRRTGWQITPASLVALRAEVAAEIAVLKDDIAEAAGQLECLDRENDRLRALNREALLA